MSQSEYNERSTWQTQESSLLLTIDGGFHNNNHSHHSHNLDESGPLLHKPHPTPSYSSLHQLHQTNAVIGTNSTLLDSPTTALNANKPTKPLLGALLAVPLGLILNLLDAMSYGYILFPISDALFADFGCDGISMFLVSTIVSQLVYASISQFRGGNGSMIIEVIPFMHIMARTIQRSASGVTSILPTIMIAYSLSTVVTAIFFFLLGIFRLGDLMGFFPRHILVGSIGGVGLFLLQTAMEVTSRVKLHFRYSSINAIFSSSAFPLWSSALAVTLLLRFLLCYPSTRLAFTRSPQFIPCFFVTIPIIFYIIIFIFGISIDTLRNAGWLFDIPQGKLFYHFFTYYDFSAIDWSLIPQLIPTMLSLSFFSVLHVPINVPALAVSTHLDVTITRELLAHAASNFLSACCGSVQNYLVYSNSVLFYRSGGDSRIASYLLALVTTAVWISGTEVFSYIPAITVGSLIFHLGIDLVKEAIWDPIGVVTWLEYGTIWSIVVSMAFWGFTEGIGVGIVLACVFFVVTYSHRPIIRTEVTGDMVSSTIRRMYHQQRFLNDVGNQIYVLEIQGFIFFGTIHQLDKKIKRLFPVTSTSSSSNKDNFSVSTLPSSCSTIRFLIIDMQLCQDIDFSAGEAFLKISRKLNDHGVVLLFSGVSHDSHIYTALHRSGVLQTSQFSPSSFNAGTMPPTDTVAPHTRSNYTSDTHSIITTSSWLTATTPEYLDEGVKCFTSLNGALEWCENRLLESLYNITAESISMSIHRPISPFANNQLQQSLQGLNGITALTDSICYSLRISPDNHPNSHISWLPPLTPLGCSPRQTMLVRAASNVVHQDVERSLSLPDITSITSHPYIYLRQLIYELGPPDTSDTINSYPSTRLFLSILPYLEYRVVTTPALIWSPGDLSDALIIVEEGVLIATLQPKPTSHLSDSTLLNYCSSYPQNRALHETILPGTMVGEVMFLCNQPYRTTLVADTATNTCGLWLFHRHRMHNLATDNPMLLLSFLQVIIRYSHEWDNSRRSGHRSSLPHGHML